VHRKTRLESQFLDATLLKLGLRIVTDADNRRGVLAPLALQQNVPLRLSDDGEVLLDGLGDLPTRHGGGIKFARASV
jgi:hypothetical protein